MESMRQEIKETMEVTKDKHNRQEIKDTIEAVKPSAPPSAAIVESKRQEIKATVEAATLPTTGQTLKQQAPEWESQKQEVQVGGQAVKPSAPPSAAKLEAKRQEIKETIEAVKPAAPPSAAKLESKRQEIKEKIEAATLPTTVETPKQQAPEWEIQKREVQVGGQAKKLEAPSIVDKDKHKRQEAKETIEALALPTTGQTLKHQPVEQETWKAELKVGGEVEKTVAEKAARQDTKKQVTKEATEAVRLPTSPAATTQEYKESKKVVEVMKAPAPAVTSKVEPEKQELKRGVEAVKEKPTVSEVTQKIDMKVKAE
ncbi:hypothetical protein LDENG_00244630, partial [Lucifuga dentata]